MSWRTNNSTAKVLYRSTFPDSPYTGNVNLELYRYQPNCAFFRCFPVKFSLYRFFVAIFISSGSPCTAFALAFARAPFNLAVSFEPEYSYFYSIIIQLPSNSFHIFYRAFPVFFRAGASGVHLKMLIPRGGTVIFTESSMPSHSSAFDCFNLGLTFPAPPNFS